MQPLKIFKMIRSSSLLVSLALVLLNFGYSALGEQWVLNKDHQTDFEVAGPKVTFKYQPKGYR